MATATVNSHRKNCARRARRREDLKDLRDHVGQKVAHQALRMVKKVGLPVVVVGHQADRKGGLLVLRMAKAGLLAVPAPTAQADLPAVLAVPAPMAQDDLPVARKVPVAR